MGKKGFTLIELLGVIIILGLIVLIVVPNVSNIINSNRDKLYQRQIDGIIDSAKTWGSEHVGKLPTINGDSVSITLKELQANGYAKPVLKNPQTGKEFDASSTIIIIKNNNGTLEYQVNVE